MFDLALGGGSADVVLASAGIHRSGVVHWLWVAHDIWYWVGGQMACARTDGRDFGGFVGGGATCAASLQLASCVGSEGQCPWTLLGDSR